MSGPREAPGVLCVGRLYCDLVFTGLAGLPAMGREIYAEGLALHAGGGAAITAAHLAAVGRPVELAALWPAPPFQEIVQRDIEAAGIGSGLCRPSGPGEPQITVAMTDGSDRAFLTRRIGPAIPNLDRDDLKGRGLAHLHIGELATLVECPWLPALARAAGLSVSLDCSWDDSASAAAGALIGKVDVFLPNEDEVAQLATLGLTGRLAPLTVIKRGAAGAWAIDDRGQVEAAGHVVPVIDTTGAGDAFNSGFLDRWLDGAPLPECLAAGNAQGARAVQVPGGFALPAESAPRGAAARP